MGCTNSKEAGFDATVSKESPRAAPPQTTKKNDAVSTGTPATVPHGSNEEISSHEDEDVSHGSSKNNNNNNKSLSKSCRMPRGSSEGLRHSVSAVGLDTMNAARQKEGNLVTNCIPFELPFGRPIEEVYDGVHDGRVLGSGISGTVREAVHRDTGHRYAVKCLDLDLIESAEGLEQLREEIFVMCQLDHPNIVRLEEVYESESEIYLVQELCTGGELFDRLDEQPDYHYTEEQCARLVKQMLCGVRYIHSRGIVHRDLKLENFLFSDRGPDSELKMIDFGLSKHFKFGERQHDAVGTPYTVAPEVIRGNYDERCDVWAIGVITYLLLSGDPPFGGCGGPEPLMEVRNNILSGRFVFEPEEIWRNVSKEATDFIKALLVTDYTVRPDAESAQSLVWIDERSRAAVANNGGNKLDPNVVKALVNFKEYSDMRKLLCEVLSFTLVPDQIKELRKEFEKLDTEGTGEISLRALKDVLVSSAGAGGLGALTEREIEDIFNAMRVRETDTTIHWHEFIAAGLSQCNVDDRNLRLAFDRMDKDHKGYITYSNVLDLLGSEGTNSEERIRKLYFEGLEEWQVRSIEITYDDFLLLMKGQTVPDISKRHQMKSIKKFNMLDSVPEFAADGSPLSLSPEKQPPAKRHSLALPTVSVPEIDTDEDDDDPLTMDDDDDVPLTMDDPVPEFDPRELERTRSASLGTEKEAPGSLRFGKRVAVDLPESNHNDKTIEKLIADESVTPLVVNRSLYRAHRQMRLAVLEASKRLEDVELRHIAAEEENRKKSGDGTNRGNNAPAIGAGLVMRHGHNRQLSARELKNILDKKRQQQQALMDKSNRQAGRGRRNRKKTVSDMTAMLASPPNQTSATPRKTFDPTTNKRNSAAATGDGSSASCPPSPALCREEPSSATMKKAKTPSDSDLQSQAIPTPPSPTMKRPTIKATPSWPPPPPL